MLKYKKALIVLIILIGLGALSKKILKSELES